MKKRILALTLIALLVLSSIPVMAGNGAPNGPHFNLNIIGVDNPKTADMDGSNGHVIFVNLDGASKIELIKGDDFQVLDANGTGKNNPAQFQLPEPGLDPYIVGEKTDEDTISDYTVWVRPLGKPGGWASITTCADLLEGPLNTFLAKKDYKFLEALNREGLFGGIASIEQVGQDVTLRTTGKDKKGFTDVTAELTTIVLALEVEILDDLGVATEETKIIMVRVPLFSDLMEDYYWEYDNHDLKLLQVRFYGHNGIVDDGVDVSLDDGDLVAPK